MKIMNILNSGKDTVIKYSPEILLTMGIGGVIAGCVLSAKATLEVKPIITDAVEKAQEVEKEDVRKKIDIYAPMSVKVMTKYIPAVVVTTSAIACILGSNNIMKNRNAALTAAYGGLFTAHQAYRQRVVDAVGEDREREIRHDIRNEVINEEVVDDNGKKKKKKKNIQVVDTSKATSPYSRFFDSSSCFWDKDPDYNFLFLRSNHNYWNEQLRVHKRVFLNDVLKSLGLEPCKEGQVVGWVYDEKNPRGDNYIDFGLYDYFDSATKDFIDGYENVILLDFNVDGNVWDDMKEGC